MSEVDTTTASVARTYDATLGGKDNFEVDRDAFRELLRVAPDLPQLTWANRRWLSRVVAYLAERAGMRQFLDVGAGLPTVQNTHQVAQRWNPDAHVVYADNDPAVNAYGRALLAENRQTWFATADLTDPDAVFRIPEVGNLDLDEPVVLMQCATLMHVPDEQDPWAIMRRYVELLPSGSYVAITNAFNPSDGSETAEYASRLEHQYLNTGMHSGRFRTPHEIRAFFDGLELLEPGLVPIDEWWPAGPPVREPGVERLGLGGVARKP